MKYIIYDNYHEKQLNIVYDTEKEANQAINKLIEKHKANKSNYDYDVIEKCEFCLPEIMDGNPIITKHSDGYTITSTGHVSFTTNLIASYCPICGRKL